MEIKCKVCGTINDGETNFCKGCFVKLDIEDPNNATYNPKEKEISASIIDEKQDIIPWDIPTESVNNVNFEPVVETNSEEVFEFKPIDENNIVPEVEINDTPMMEVEIDFRPIEELEAIKNENIIEPIVENSIEEPITEIEDIITSGGGIVAIPVDVMNNQRETEEELVEETNVIENEDNEINAGLDIVEKMADEIIEKEEINPILENSNVLESDEESIPELWQDDINNLQNNELPELDMSQFEKDDWNEEVEIEEQQVMVECISPIKLVLKFLLNCILIGIIFGVLCIGFRYVLTHMFDMGNKAELIFIVISSVTSIATLLIATDMTFKKGIPLATKINSTTFSILFLIALPYLLIKLAYNLYIGTTFVILLILIALTLIILAIFFNYMRTIIRNKHAIKGDDKGLLIYGVFSIILVVLTLYGVYMFKDKDSNISFGILINDSENVHMVETYINEVEKSLSKNITEIDGYTVPDKIEDVNYAVIDGNKPDGMVLYINKDGKVISGTVVIGQKVYSYDGENIKAN